MLPFQFNVQVSQFAKIPGSSMPFKCLKLLALRLSANIKDEHTDIHG